jgi:NADH:quinone reductase (non-electrogenic)
VLVPGGVTRSFPIPGLPEKARGLKSLGEAMYLRDHVLQQLELADASDDPDERRARCTFVAVARETMQPEPVSLWLRQSNDVKKAEV